MDKRGKFIVIDGVDGAGKGTQIKLLREKLGGKDVFFTREPGGRNNALAEEIRTLVLRKEGPPSNPETDYFLFYASRAAHIRGTVAPLRDRGVDVISDRYDSSTWSLQIWGEEKHDLMPLFEAVRRSLEPKEYNPDLYIFLDLPAEVAYARRMNDATQEKSKFDIKPLAYHERVEQGYQSFAQHFGPVQFVNANRPIEEVHEDVWSIVSRELGIN